MAGIGNNGEKIGTPNRGFTGSTIREVDLIQAVGAKDPVKLDAIIEAWASRRMNPGFSELLDQRATVREFENDNEFYWDIVNEQDPNEPVLYARDENGVEIDFATDPKMVGVDNLPFEIVFKNKRFFEGDNILPELPDYPLMVLGEPTNEGVNVCYKVQCIGTGIGIPSKFLLPGKLFSFGYALREDEMSRKQGGIEYYTTSQMRSCWSKMRYDLKLSANVMDNRVNIAKNIQYTDTATGKAVKAETGWVPAILANFNLKWKNMKNNMLLYGRDNMDENGEYKNFGRAGSMIKSAPGLYEQMSWGHQEFYSEPKALLGKITDKLMSICEGRIAFGERNFTAITGERGAAIIAKAIEEIASGWTRFEYDGEKANAMKKTTAKHIVNGQTAFAASQPVFTEYIFGNSYHLTVIVDPSYSAYGVNNKIMHPDGGVANSYRVDMFDLGTSSEPNILRCKLRGKEDDWVSYGVGVRDPWHNNTHVNYAMTDEDSGFISYGWTGAVAVLDPTRCCSFIPNILDPSNI